MLMHHHFHWADHVAVSDDRGVVLSLQLLRGHFFVVVMVPAWLRVFIRRCVLLLIY